MTQFGMPTLVELPSLERAAALCRRLGLRFIEINMSFPAYQPEKLDLALLRRLKEEYGIYYTVHIDESLDPCSVNPGIARVYTETMLRTIEIAKQLEIPVLNMHLLRGVYVTLPDRRTYVYSENMPFYLEKLRAFRDAVTEAVGDSGVRVCIENTDGFDLPFLTAAVDLLLESPAFALTLDIGHDHAIRGIDLPVILARRDRLMHMHMHDAVGENVHLALGDGEMDKDWYLELAADCGCRVVLETKTVEALEKSVPWLEMRRNRLCCPDELWDVYDAQGSKTGAVHRRGEPMADGEWHLCVHVWVQNSRGEFLLTRRHPEKSMGGRWESVGGCVVAGEDSLSTALREVAEETGLALDPARGELLLRYGGPHFFCDVWRFRQDFDADALVLQEGETCGAMAADADTVRALAAQDRFVELEYLEQVLRA